jgi:tetratricopeptide (TPR) repeat protein
MHETQGQGGGQATLEQRVDVMKQEIDALQIEAMRTNAPWYRQVPVLVPLVVSVLAFVFSLATTVVGERRIAREEEHETRVELRELIQRLTVLPKENFELNRRYAGDPVAIGALAPLVNTENQVLGQQAAELIDELEGDVTATQYWAVAYALGTAGLSKRSDELLDQGIEAARPNAANDVQGYLALLRQRANSYFTLGQLENGRRLYRRASGIFDAYPERNRFVIANVQASTLLGWATAELSVGACEEARAQLRAAQEHVPQATIPSVPPQSTALEKNIDRTCDPGAQASGE